MVTQTKPIDGETEATETVNAIEEMLSGIRLTTSSAEPQDNLSTKFVRLLVALHDCLAGPARTKRDRLRHDITEHQRHLPLG